MTTPHRVVVAKCDLEEYEKKGYRRTEGESLAEHVGAGWELLPPEERAQLCLVEIDAAKHRAMNTPERAFCVHQRAKFMTDGAELLKLDVLQRPEVGERNTLCASADFDDGPRWFVDAELGTDARQAVAIARPSLLEAIAEHRRIADELESFLMGMEAL